MNGHWSNCYASFTRRAVARFIDLCLVTAVCASFYFIDRLLGFPLRYTSLFAYSRPLSLEMFLFYDLPGILITFFATRLFISFPYYALMESSHWQATLGKLAADIKITDLSGERISFGRPTGRYFLKAFSTFLFMLGYLLAFSDQKQAWHDYIARTIVIRRAVFPAYYALPRVGSRWLFTLPFVKPDRTTTAPIAGYMCLFCRYRSSEKHLGCPSCSVRYGFGEVRAMGALELMNGIVFTVIGGALLFESAKMLGSVIAAETPWYILVLVLAIGAVLTTGGVSAFFGRNWLLKWLLALVTQTAERRNRR
jgi:uncharacterized RDD family membrane protein YckC